VTSGTSIRYGLGNIKGVGEKAVASILAQRPYTKLETSGERWLRSPVTRAMPGHQVLAAVGAFDGLVVSRRALEAH